MSNRRDYSFWVPVARIWASVVGIGMALPAAAQSSAPDLNTCAPITTQAERLACYDKLAGRSPPQPAATSQPAPTPTAPVASPPPPGSPEAFGLYAAEHPTAPKSNLDSIAGKVVDLSHDSYGRETISLEGGAVWQLAGSDALLAKGDSVTIKRGALGSYMMTTPAGRVHRVRRQH